MLLCLPTIVLRVLCQVPCYADYDGSSLGSLRCVDADGDGMVTWDEVDNVHLMSKSVGRNDSIFQNNTNLVVFREFRYFKNIIFANSLFSGCTNLRHIELPPIKEYWENIFRDCTSLEELVVPEGVEKYYAYIVRSCTSLKYLDLPSTLIEITDDMARTMSGYILIVRATTPPKLGGWGAENNPAVVFVPDESVELYKTAATWSSKASLFKPLSEYAG